MKNLVIKNLIYLISVLSLCFIVFFGIFALGGADTACECIDTSVSAAVVSGGDLWDSSSSKINDTALADLIKKLFGGTNPVDPVTYITTNGTQEHGITGSYVVNAAQIRARSGDIELRLGNIDWMVASLTLDTSNNVIATLYQKDSSSTSTKFYTSNTTAETKSKGANMYSSSTLRSTLLSMTSYSLFKSGSFATKYLVQPKDIKYQEVETQYGRANPIYDRNWNLSNDAYGNLSSNWYSYISSEHYIPTYTYNGIRYDAWKNDYIWIPSATETGYSNYLNTSSIWRLSSAQLSHSNTACYTRSGCCVNFDYAYSITRTGIWNSTKVADYSYNIRPAIHFNLSAASSIVKPPKLNGTYTYNRSNQTINTSSFTDFDTAKMKIEKIERTTTLPTTGSYTEPTCTDTSVTFTEAGKYEITLKGKTVTGSTDAWLFSDTGKDETTIEFEVKKAQLTVPNFGTGTSSSKDYTGSALTFTASNCPSSKVTGYPRDPLSVTISKKTGTMTETPTVTWASSGTLEVKLKNAGEYKATFTIEDDINYEWSGGGSGTKDANFTIKPKQLSITSTTTKGNNWSWKSDENESGSITVSGVESGDTVDLQLEITDGSGNTSQLASSSASGGSYTFNIDKNISVFGGNYPVGSYKLKPVIGGAGASDANYSLDTALAAISSDKKGYTLTLSAASAGLTSYAWTYTTDGLNSQSITSNRKLKYTLKAGSTTSCVTYELSVDESQFAANYIAIDTSKGTNGYDTRSANTVGTYTTTVYLKTVDNDHQFGNGTHSDTATISWEIEKGTFDVSGVKWESGGAEYTGALPWKGTNYTLTIMPSSLPAGLAVRTTGTPYSGNKEKSVGNYTATCNSFTYDAANFNAPSAITLNWEIEKAKVTITPTSWLTDITNTDSSTSTIFFTPHLDSPYDGTGIKYNYYKINDDGTSTALSGISDITATASEIQKYYIEAYIDGTEIAADGKPYTDCIEFDEQYAPDHGPYTYEFTTGDNKTPVAVSVSGSGLDYDGTPHDDVKILIGGSSELSTSDFEIKYYKANPANPSDLNDLSGGEVTRPTAAGDYIIIIKLKGSAEDDYALNASRIAFSINKAKLDLSSARWGYTDESGNDVEYTNSVPFGLNSDGSAKEWELQLVSLPDASTQTLSGLNITYTGNKASNVNQNGSMYTATYSLTYDEFNFDLIPPDANYTPSSYDWRISTKVITAPENATFTYNGDGFDLVVKSGLDSSELDVYYTATVSVYDEINNVWNAVGSDFDITNVEHAGKYRIVYNLKDTTNVRWLKNGNQSQSAQTADIEIEKLIITLTGWEGPDSERKSPVFNNGAVSVDEKLYKIEITDGEGNDASGSWMTGWNTTFTETLSVADEYLSDVEIVSGADADGNPVPLVITFTVGDDPTLGPALEIDKPTLKESRKEYTGKDITFEFEGWHNRDGNAIYYRLYDADGNEIDSADGKFVEKEIGKYKVYIRIPTVGNYKWKDTQDKSEVEYEYEIVKRKLPVIWGTTEGGKPEAKYPDSYEGPRDVYEYKYFDGEGNEVPEESLEGGKEYTVGVKVKDEYAGTTELTDAEGKVIETSIYEGKYVVPEGGFIGFMKQKFLFGLEMWIWLIIFLVLLLLIVLFIILGVRHKKKAEAKRALAEEKKAEAEERRRREEAEERRQEREMRMQMQMPMMMPQMQMQQPMAQQAAQSAQSVNVDGNVIAELKEEIKKLRAEQSEASTEAKIAERVAAAKSEAEERARVEMAQQAAALKAEAEHQALSAKMEAEFARMRAENRYMIQQVGMNAQGRDALGGLLVAALRKYASDTQDVSMIPEERPALPESNIVSGVSGTNNVVPGAITTTTTTTTVDATGSKAEEKPAAVSGTVENIPNAEGLFNRRGRSKTDGYDPDNFYNFFDEQENKK